MSNVGGIYTALVDAARNDDPEGLAMLREIGGNICAKNAGYCRSVEDGVAAAKRALKSYCQAFPHDVAEKVRTFYGLDAV